MSTSFQSLVFCVFLLSSTICRTAFHHEKSHIGLATSELMSMQHAYGHALTDMVPLHETKREKRWTSIQRESGQDEGKVDDLVSLVLLLLDQTSRRQFVIVYDDTTPGVTKIIGAVQEAMTDTIVLQYEDDLTTLEVILRSTFSTENMRNILLLCSTENIIATFEKVRERSLELPSVQWIVIAERDITSSLLKVLREGSQVAVIIREGPSQNRLFSSFVDGYDRIRFEYTGNMDVRVNTSTNVIVDALPPSSNSDVQGTEGSISEPSHYLRRPLFKPLDTVYENFQGRRLLVTVVSNIPYFSLRILSDGFVVPDAGIDFQVTEALAQRLNFTYSILPPDDGRWGGPEADGTVSGMIGMVANHRVHFAIDEITITTLRETVVDFSDPYIVEGTTLVSRAPTKKDPTLAVIQPFPPLIWLIVAMITAAIGPVTYFIARCHDSFCPRETDFLSKRGSKSQDPLHPGKTSTVGPSSSQLNMTSSIPKGSSRLNISYYSFNMFRSLVVQGNFIIADKVPIRLILVSWYIFCLVMYSIHLVALHQSPEREIGVNMAAYHSVVATLSNIGLYAGTLTAFMTIPAYEKPINSPNDLLEAHKDGFVPAVQRKTSNEYFLKSADSGIFKELWEIMDPSRSFPSGGSQAIGQVLTLDTVYMTGNLNAKIRTSQRGSRLFYLSRERFLVTGLGIALRTGAPYRQKFNHILLRLNQGGLINKWINDEVRKLPSKADGNQEGGETSSRGDGQALTLSHLQAAFFILVGGYFLATFILLTEIQASSCGPKINS